MSEKNDETLANLLKEDRRFEPPADLAEHANLTADAYDAAAKDRARAAWREVSSGGMKAVYWAQDNGRWVKRAESGG